MKYTKYNVDKNVYIIDKNLTSKSELDAQWKEDVGIPISEIDTDSIIKTIKETKKGTEYLYQHSFIVSHNKHRYIVTFSIEENYEIYYVIRNVNSMNYSRDRLHRFKTGRDIRWSPYLIMNEDLDTWEKSRQQVIRTLGLSFDAIVDLTIY